MSFGGDVHDTANEMHPATIWEALADRLGDEAAIVQGPTTISWEELDRSAAALAATLEAAGVGPGSKVGVYLYNGPEYITTYLAAFKLRAKPVNINYRYLDVELAHILSDADAEAVVFHSSLADRIAGIDTSALTLLVQVPDDDTALMAGAVGWSDALASAPAVRRARSEDDHHLLYTGGTTGLPKGVIYELGGLTRELVTLAAPFLGAAPPSTVADTVALAAESRRAGTSLVSLVLPPLMHGTGMAVAFITLNVGGTIVLQDTRQLDPTGALAAIDEHGVSVLSLVGDAFGRPILRSLDEASEAGRAPDLSSLRLIMSSGAMLATETKTGLLRHAPGALIIDTLAASEASMGSSITHAGSSTPTGAFALRPGTRVLDEADRDVEPGSGVAGRVAVAATNPIGYYNDPEKTAATFRTIDGRRYTCPGDWATVEADGALTLLGRGSHCINTGGEKVFPEEVEEALKTHPAVDDALVIGTDDDRWGQQIEAVISTTGNVDGAELINHVKARLAAYKAPKIVHLVPEVPRAANGKADYPAARRLALETSQA